MDGMLIIGVVFLLLSASEPCPEICSCSDGSVSCRNTSIVKITFNLNEGTEVLDLSYNLIEILHNEFFDEINVATMTSICLNDNSISSVEPEVFKWFEALRHLYLQNNNIKSLHPSSFQNNINLTTLDLSGNELMTINPKIFEGNHILSWVNIMRNSLNVSSINPTIFSSSLNTLDIEMCTNPKYSVNSFQNIPILKQFNLTESKVFTVQTFMSYQNTELRNVSSESYVFSKLNKLGFSEFDEFRYSEKYEVILSPSNSSLMCFCARLSAWFWCYEKTFPCAVHTSDIYSPLNCASSSVSPSTLIVSSLVTSTTAVTESQISLKNNKSISFTLDPEDEHSNSVHTTLYVGVGVGILVIIVATTACVLKKRRRENTIEGRAQYTTVPLAISESINSAPPLYYDSADVTKFPQPYATVTPILKHKLNRATPSGSATATDIVREIRV
jgi:Leucine-rich repeat (LRR) protein